MKKLYILISALVLLSAFVLHILISTGYFRDIEPYSELEIVDVVSIAGVEDITVAREDGFALLSAYDRAGHRQGSNAHGGIYYLNLLDSVLSPKLISARFSPNFHCHGIALLKLDSIRYQVLAVNHTEGHTIEIFTLTGDVLSHEKTLKNPLMVSPNDVIPVGNNRFYFTNDHGYTSGLGRIAEDYLGLRASNVVYYDGSQYTIAAENIAYANGINFDATHKLLYVASPRDFMVKVYDVMSDFSLKHRLDIDAKTGVDNLEIDASGNIWSGGHPNLLAFTSYASGKTPIAHSEIVRIVFHDTNQYTVETKFLDDGNLVSGSSVAATFKDLVLVGNVMDNQFLITRQILPVQ